MPASVRLYPAGDASRPRGGLAFGPLVLIALVVVGRGVWCQFPAAPPAIALDSLLRSRGPVWREEHSQHFVLYTERLAARPVSPTRLLENLEEAWRHDVALLGVPVANQRPITVLVTHAASRFPGLLAPSNRGLMRATTTGADLIILVHNDSIRAFTNHEVMHALAHRAWGTPGAAWVDEGLATWADGRCQSTSVLAVARDLLQAEPGLTLEGIPGRFAAGAGPLLGPRNSAYVIAASVVGFVHEQGGSDAVHHLWRSGAISPYINPLDDTLTWAWRNYVRRAAGREKGVSPAALAAHGCD